MTEPAPRTCQIDVSRGHLGITLAPSAFKRLGGVTLEWRHDADLAAQAGLTAGDHLLSFNKQPLSDPAAAIGIVDSMMGTGILEIEFLPAADAQVLAKSKQKVARSGRLIWVAVVVALAAFAAYEVDRTVMSTNSALAPAWSQSAIRAYKAFRQPAAAPLNTRQPRTGVATPQMSSSASDADGEGPSMASMDDDDSEETRLEMFEDRLETMTVPEVGPTPVRTMLWVGRALLAPLA